MKYKDEKIISIYFAPPGSGKTTFAASLVRKCNKHKLPVYSNVPIVGAYEFDCVADLGVHQIEDCKVIIDEAGIEYNNREFKSFPKTSLVFFKLHRHYGVSIDIFSQSWDDMDKKIRALAQRYYVVKRTSIPWLITARPIYRRISVNEQNKEICDEYYFKHWLSMLFCSKYIIAPLYWSMFDSYEAPKLPPMQKRPYKHR